MHMQLCEYPQLGAQTPRPWPQSLGQPSPSHLTLKGVGVKKLQNLHFFDNNSFVVSNGKEMATPNFVAMGGVSAHPVGDIRNPACTCAIPVRSVFARTAQHSVQCSAAVQMLSLPPTSVECGFDTCPPILDPPDAIPFLFSCARAVCLRCACANARKRLKVGFFQKFPIFSKLTLVLILPMLPMHVSVLLCPIRVFLGQIFGIWPIP